MKTTSHFSRWHVTTKQQIELTLNNILASQASATRLQQAMQYSLKAGGKRIRPLLCIAACDLLGGSTEVHFAACAIEMLHTYSLIHDDLPAMDDDDLRRGKPSCHKAFDAATAILAGDALQALAFDVLATNGQFTDPQRVAMIRCLSQAAGATGMVAGQMLDTEAEQQQLNQAQLENVHYLKTGKLIEAALLIGAHATPTTTPDSLAVLAELGKTIGLAFQVQDDILDVTGNTEQLGKQHGADSSRHKSTFPQLLGLANSRTYANQLAEKSLALLDAFDSRADTLRQLVTSMVNRSY